MTLPSKAVTRVVVFGGLGRIGRRLCSLITHDPSFCLVGVVCKGDDPLVGRRIRDVEPGVAEDCNICVQPILEEFPQGEEGDKIVIIDFSSPDATMSLIRNLLTRSGMYRLVCGTTGLSASQKEELTTAAKSVPILHAMNFSLGVNLVAKIAADVAQALGEKFDIEIVDIHHNQKVDAPSGTAFAIADSICAATGRNRTCLANGMAKQSRNEIGIHALRMGNVVGEHTVNFASTEERIEISHKAQHRDVFAAGALRAAKWLANSQRLPGTTYTMEEVLFGSTSRIP